MSRLIRLYTFFQFFFGLLLWLPIFYEYQKRMGLSEAEIFQIQSLYQIVFCFLEIPTGWFADRFGYLRSMRLGALVLVVANLLPLFAFDFQGFLTHFILIALARSFISGASSAYLYEALRERREEAHYQAIEGAARAYGLFGKVFGWAGVGVLMQWQLSLPYSLTALASFASLIFAMRLPKLIAARIEEQGRATAPSSPAFFEAFAALGRSPILILVMFQGVAIFVLSRIAQVTLFQPILDAKEIPLGAHGLVMSAMTLFEAFGSWKPQWARRWMGDRSLVTTLTLSLAVTLGALPWLGATGTLVSLCVFSLAVGWSFPVQKQVMNDAIPDSRFRATLLSIESIVDRGVSALVTLVLADAMAAKNLDGFLINSAIATIIAAILISLLMKTALQRAHGKPHS